jgi:uncharacterized membrane protein SpoIIM required for sporulation
MTGIQTEKASSQSAALAHWLDSRKAAWELLEAKLKAGKPESGQELADARTLLSGYRALLSDLSLSRRVYGKGLISRYLEDLFLKAHEELYRPAQQPLARIADLYQLEIPVLMRRMSSAFFITFLLFVLSILSGWLLVSAYPELVGLFASQDMIEKVQTGELWTDGLLNVMPSSLLSASIATNNITVTLFAFALGAFYGVGTLYIIGMNGLMLGGLFAFTASYGLGGRLFAFIIGHGVVELSVILIAGSMGLQLGEALVRPGTRNRLQAFQETSANTGKILLAATPFLIVAGLIEGFISPDPRFSLLERIIVGLSSGAIFWLILLFGLPQKGQAK